MLSRAMRRFPASRWLGATAWLAGAVPLLNLLRDAAVGDLGANPIEEIIHRAGWWGLFFLVATLAITPLRRVTRWHAVIRVRRTLGLTAFGYLTLHLLAYLGLDQFFDFRYIAEDVLERPYITVGVTAWLLLAPLAVTSTRGWIRRLGSRWRRLHRLVYAASLLGVLHYYWNVKADTRAPLAFALAVLGLLAARVLWARKSLRSSNPPGRPSEAASAPPA